MDIALCRINSKENEVFKIALPISDGLIFIDVNNISFIKADSEYNNVLINDGSHKIVKNLLNTSVEGECYIFLNVELDTGLFLYNVVWIGFE